MLLVVVMLMGLRVWLDCWVLRRLVSSGRVSLSCKFHFFWEILG